MDDDVSEIEMPKNGIFEDIFPKCNVSLVMEAAVGFIRGHGALQQVLPVEATSVEEEISACVQKIANHAKTLELSKVYNYVWLGMSAMPSNHPGFPWIVQGFELWTRVQGNGAFVQVFFCKSS